MRKISKKFMQLFLVFALLCLVGIPSSAAEKKADGTVTLNKTTISIYKGQKVQLTAALPGTSREVIWKSANKKIAAVSSAGIVTGKKAGQTKITATIDGKTAQCVVNVKNATITLDQKKASLYAGRTLKLTAKVGGVSQNITWKSSNKKIATVDANGLITAKKAGKVTITAKANGKTAKCIVTVKKPGLKLNKTTASVNTGATVQLTAEVTGSPKVVTWKSSNKNIATVSATGKVTGKKAGKVTITATCYGKSVKCKVTVKKAVPAYCSAYASYLSKYPALTISDSNYYDASYSPSNTNYISAFALHDIDEDGVPELIARTDVNFRWNNIRIYTYKNGSVQPMKFYEGGNVMFYNRATANGGYYFYVCKNGHVHNAYNGGWSKAEKVYINSNGKLRKYLSYTVDNMMGFSGYYKYDSKITATQYTQLTKSCTESKITYYLNNSVNRTKLKAGTIK